MSDDEPRGPVGARFHRPAARPPVPDTETPTADLAAAPDDPAPFDIVRRGYDRAQVHARIHALEAQVRALQQEVRQVRAERAEAERTAWSLRTGARGEAPDHDVEDKIARVARHEAARMRVTALTEAARLLEDASAEDARAREDARRAAAERAAADRELAERLARLEERERRLRERD